MLLKKYQLIDHKPQITDQNQVFGYAHIKKENSRYSMAIALNNFVPVVAYVVVNGAVIAAPVAQQGTKIELPCPVTPENVAVVIPKLSLYAANSLQTLQNAYLAVVAFSLRGKQNNLSNANSQSSAPKIVAYSEFCKTNSQHLAGLEKVFGKPVLATYFFDYLKSKLAKLFAMGKPCAALGAKFASSRWVKLAASGNNKVVGVLYYLGFPFAIGVGEQLKVTQAKANLSKNVFLAGDNFYKIQFFSAADGKPLYLTNNVKTN